MHIYIYGEKSFKKTIHDALEHGNVKFHLDENGTIEELNSLEALKLAIEDEPDNIYLIDHEKIIDKKSFNSKIKFLTPKDGIEKEFLDEHGIEDIAIDDIKDLPKYIIKKLDALHLTDTFDENDNITANTTTASISEDEIDAISDILEDIENIENKDDSDDDFDLGDDLKDLLSSDDEESENDDDIIEDEIDDIADVMNIDLEEDTIEDVANISDVMNIQLENNDQGMQDMEELSQLDNVKEDEMIAALSGIEDIDLGSNLDIPKVKDTKNDSQAISIDASNVNDLSSLLTQLLNNKTLEITVKIKD